MESNEPINGSVLSLHNMHDHNTCEVFDLQRSNKIGTVQVPFVFQMLVISPKKTFYLLANEDALFVKTIVELHIETYVIMNICDYEHM